MAFIIENDIRILLPVRDINILLKEDDGDNSEVFLTQRVNFAIDFVKGMIQHRYNPVGIFIEMNVFDYNADYVIGDAIYYSEDAYVNTTEYSSGDRVSYEKYIYEHIAGAPTTGTLPTDTATWSKKVRNNTYYTCTADSINNYPENTAYFSVGDPRNALIFTYTLYIAVYELFKKVQPTMVPEWLISSRDEANEYLKQVARGIVTMSLPIYDDPQKGQEISYNFKYPTQDYDF